MSKKRPRSERRASERRQEKLVKDKLKLIALEPGAAAENPIQVGSASVIDTIARSLECARCGPELAIVDQTARVVLARVRRIVELRCKRCGAARTAHFVVAPPLLQ